jgi:TRAP-type C4-dicarboxylate transport system permease small subunit
MTAALAIIAHVLVITIALGIAVFGYRLVRKAARSTEAGGVGRASGLIVGFLMLLFGIVLAMIACGFLLTGLFWGEG